MGYEITEPAAQIEIERNDYDAVASPEASGNVFQDGEIVRELGWETYSSPFKFNVRLKTDVDVSGDEPSDEEEDLYREISEELSNELDRRANKLLEATKGMPMDEKVDFIKNVDPDDFFEE